MFWPRPHWSGVLNPRECLYHMRRVWLREYLLETPCRWCLKFLPNDYSFWTNQFYNIFFFEYFIIYLYTVGCLISLGVAWMPIFFNMSAQKPTGKCICRLFESLSILNSCYKVKLIFELRISLWEQNISSI